MQEKADGKKEKGEKNRKNRKKKRRKIGNQLETKQKKGETSSVSYHQFISQSVLPYWPATWAAVHCAVIIAIATAADYKETRFQGAEGPICGIYDIYISMSIYTRITSHYILRSREARMRIDAIWR